MLECCFLLNGLGFVFLAHFEVTIVRRKGLNISADFKVMKSKIEVYFYLPSSNKHTPTDSKVTSRRVWSSS